MELDSRDYQETKGHLEDSDQTVHLELLVLLEIGVPLVNQEALDRLANLGL